MGKLKINGVVGGNFSSFTVDGVRGYFRSVARSGFCKIYHHFDGNYVLVANPSNGQTGEGGLKPMPNPQKHAQIMERLEKYVAKFLDSQSVVAVI